MVDTSRVNSGQKPLGTNQPFRSTSADALVGAGPGGNGQIRRVTGRDGPAVGWNPIHITTTNRFNSTAGNNGFREFVVAFSNTFPRNYFALARGDWTITYAGNRNGLGRWANTASGVAIPGAVGGAAALTAVNQTGDTANAQVRGLSFVNEFKMIYNP